MPALSYKAQLVMPVWNGTKPHTIRGWRRRPFKVGDVLQHYTAMRTKACRKIRPDTICTAVREITITISASQAEVYVSIGGRTLLREETKALALRDGFAGIAEFRNFFHQEHGLFFSGQLVEWNPFAPAPGATPENGEPGGVKRIARAIHLAKAPFSPVQSRPARAGKREPRGRRISVGCSSTPRGVKKPGRNFQP